tara:strand:+ start:339 stop:635 length:297 start_codon:yes stop_codon:yes gene_type:complete
MKIKKKFLLSIFFLGLILILFNDTGIITLYKLKNERKILQNNIKKLAIHEKKLIEELDLLESNEEYIKKIAREKYHMVKPGEKMFKVLNKNKQNKLIE